MDVNDLSSPDGRGFDWRTALEWTKHLRQQIIDSSPGSDNWFEANQICHLLDRQILLRCNGHVLHSSGLLQDAIECDAAGRPVDKILAILSDAFRNLIVAKEWDPALEVLDAIDLRAAEIACRQVCLPPKPAPKGG